MSSDLVINKDYKVWLADIKLKVRNAQIKAALKVNTELLTLYWELGADIVAKQAAAKWGDGFLLQLSKDLTAEFPDMKGFSERNLKYIRAWYLFYSQEDTIGQQAVAQLADSNQADLKVQQLVGQIQEAEKNQQIADLITKQTVSQITQIPWGHNIVIITKCKNLPEASYYIQNTITHNWSRSVLVHQIESGLYKREGKAVNNFAATLPKPQSDLAKQTLKDPYIFDFLRLTKEYDERDLENGLTQHVSKFLLKLGAGFSYFGRQNKLESDSYIFFIFGVWRIFSAHRKTSRPSVF